jgi:hypothetical protein
MMHGRRKAANPRTALSRRDHETDSGTSNMIVGRKPADTWIRDLAPVRKHRGKA